MVNPDKAALDPDQERKRTARLARQQMQLDREAFAPVKERIDVARTVGVVLVGEARSEIITNGVRATYPKENVLWLDWYTVQDPNLDEETASRLTDNIRGMHRSSGANGLIVVEDADYSPLREAFVNPLGEHLVAMCNGGRRQEPGVLVVGPGTHDELTFDDEFLVQGHQLGGLTERLALRIGLLPTDQFKTWTWTEESAHAHSPIDIEAANRLH